MAAETERERRPVRRPGKWPAWAGLIMPKNRLLRELFAERVGPKGLEGHLDDDAALLIAMDTISDTIEENVERWNAELDLIEEDLSRSTALGRKVEAAAQ